MGADNSHQAPEGGEDPRLASLDERLKAAHHIEAERTAPKGGGGGFTGKGVAQGNRVLSTLIGYPAGAAVLGLLADQLLGTLPTGVLIGLALGVCAAFYQIIKISKEKPE